VGTDVTAEALPPWRRFHRHLQGLWPRYGLLPLIVFGGWPAYCLATGERRWELALPVLLGAIMPYVGPRAKRVFLGIMPIGIVGLFYDSMRFVKNVGLSPERVHVCDLRALEIRWFGIQMNGQPATVHDWVQTHPNLALDVLCSIPYGTFIGAAALFALFLYFVDYAAMRRFTSAFLAMNVLAFITYHVYPAAPPWYYHAHGCAVDLATRASEGPNLARVDAWLGVRYFGGFYGRSNDIFGAVPSLHVAYPLLIAIEGYRPFALRGGLAWLKWPLRIGSATFFIWMACAAVYLDHHWILDVICGCAYALVVYALFRSFRIFASDDRGTGIESAPHGTPGLPARG